MAFRCWRMASRRGQSRVRLSEARATSRSRANSESLEPERHLTEKLTPRQLILLQIREVPILDGRRIQQVPAVHAQPDWLLDVPHVEGQVVAQPEIDEGAG